MSLRAAWRRFRWNAELFRFLPSAETDPDLSADAIGWMPPVSFQGDARHALRVPAGADVSYCVRLRPGSRITAACAPLPAAGNAPAASLEFALQVEVPALGWRARRSIRSDPPASPADRRWRRLALRLPARATGEAIVRLSTRVRVGAAGEPPQGLWGEPRIEWPRARADMWRSVVGLAARIRRGGLAGTMRYVRGLPASDDHAAAYRHWVALNTPSSEELAAMAAEAGAWAEPPLISVLTPVYNTDPRWLRASIESVRRQVYPRWELCLADDGSSSAATLAVLREYEDDPRIRQVRLTENRGISAATNAALGTATGEFLALLDHDDELAPEALYEVARRLERVPDADFIYSDEDKLDASGERCDPHFKPDWSPEHFRSAMYTCHLMVLRASTVRELGGWRPDFDGAQDYDLALRVVERTARVEHIPTVLYHWRKASASASGSGLAKPWAIAAGQRALQEHVVRSGLDAVVHPGPLPGLYRVRYAIKGQPLVSIVIPTIGGAPGGSRTAHALTACIRSIIRQSTYERIEIVIAEDAPLADETIELLGSVPHRRVRYEASGRFNFARKMNFAVAHSRGTQLLLLNDDVEVIAPGWIEAMLELSQQEAVGAVGARLVFPDGRLQHVGVILGVCGLAAHAYHSSPGSTAGHGASAIIIRNYSAVTAACMMTRREVFERLEGFDERFASDFNDTDYCLRLRRTGLRVVYTPYAELRHRESASFGARLWDAGDLETMRRTWADVCANDPYYNPQLTRDFPDFRVQTSPASAASLERT